LGFELPSPAVPPPEADALAVFDARGDLLAWNPEFAALLSLRAEQVGRLDLGRYCEMILFSASPGTASSLRVLEQLSSDLAASLHLEVELIGPPAAHRFDPLDAAPRSARESDGPGSHQPGRDRAPAGAPGDRRAGQPA
jgi:PAS domain-containing protein